MPAPDSLSSPLWIFTFTLVAGSEFTLFNAFESLTQAPFLQTPQVTHHTSPPTPAHPPGNAGSLSTPGSCQLDYGHHRGWAIWFLSLRCVFRGLCTPREILTSWGSCLGGALSQGSLLALDHSACEPRAPSPQAHRHVLLCLGARSA